MFEGKGTDWLKVFTDIGARKQGPVWKLASGMYSDIEYDMWRVYERGKLYSRACRDLLQKASIGRLSPAIWFVGLERDGIALALELSRQTGASAGFATKRKGGAELSDFTFPSGTDVYLVVDVHSAGTTFVRTREAVEQRGGNVLDPVLAIVNRSGTDRVCLWPNTRPTGYFHDRHIVSLVETNEPGWRLEDCPPHLKNNIRRYT